MKPEKAKKQRDVFRSNPNKIVRWKYKSKQQEKSIQNIKLLYEALKAVIKLFNHSYSIASAAKCIVYHRKWRQFMEKDVVSNASRITNSTCTNKRK